MKRLATYLYFRESGFSRRDAWRVATGAIKAHITSWAELQIDIKASSLKFFAAAVMCSILLALLYGFLPSGCANV